MTAKRKLVRRSFLAAVSGVGALTLAACSDPSDAGPGNNSANGNRATSAPAPETDSDAG